MVAVVSNLRHDVLTDIVGLLWVVSYVGIHRVVYQTIGDASPMASPSASELSAWQHPCQMGRCAAFADLVHHGGMMHCSGGVKEWGIEAGGDYSYSMRTRASIDSFNIDIFALDLSWNSSGSGAAILCLQHLLKVSGRTLTILYKVITNW